jgi:hydrogenase-4 component F
MIAALVSLLAIPLLLGLLTFLSPDIRLSQALTVVGGVATFILAGSLLGLGDGGRISAVGGLVYADSLSLVLLLAVSMVYAASTVFAVGYLRCEEGATDFPRYARNFYALLNLFAFTMLLVPATDNLGVMWAAVELTTIVSALMVGLEGTSSALEAAWKYILIASAGLALALLGVVLLYASGTASLGSSYEPNWTRLLAASKDLEGDTVRLAFMFALIGFGTKAGLVPMHTWLPDAHSEGPTPVSALLSGALLADAMYAVFRFYGITVQSVGPDFPRTLLFIFGLASLILAGFFVLIQRDFKRLLAYSSIEHMGVLAVGAAFGTPLALYGVALHILTHAATKSMAFFGAGSILRKLKTRETAKVSGLIHLVPATAVLFLVAGLAISGLPLFGIFRSEFLILAGGFSRGGILFLPAALLLVLVNLAFLGLFRYANGMVLGEPPSGVKAGEASWWMVAAMVFALVFVLGLGVWVPDVLSDTLRGAARVILGER